MTADEERAAIVKGTAMKVSERILTLLGGYRDDMPAGVVTALQNIAKQDASARQAGIREGIEMAAKVAEEVECVAPDNPYNRALANAIATAIRALAGERE